MAKQRTIFSCQNCGAQSPRWIGRCPECSNWNTYAEEAVEVEARRPSIAEAGNGPVTLEQISAAEGRHIPTGIDELDRTLGSGFIPGGITLLGGDPGIGKSTIVMQALSKVASAGKKILYISGEESASQIKLRAERMELDPKNFSVLTENCVEKIVEQLRKIKPALIAIDSIQTMYTGDLPSAPGTISQVRESAAKILSFAKAAETAEGGNVESIGEKLAARKAAGA